MVNPHAAKAHAGGGGDAFSRPAGPAQTVIPRQNRAVERGDGAFAIERFFCVGCDGSPKNRRPQASLGGRRAFMAFVARKCGGFTMQAVDQSLLDAYLAEVESKPEAQGESCPYRQSAVRSRGRARSSYGSGMNWAICQARSSLRRDCRHARPSRPHPACRGSGELRFRSRHERSASTKTMTISITSCRGRHSAAAGRTARRQGQTALTRPAGLGLPAVFALFRASSRQERIDII